MKNGLNDVPEIATPKEELLFELQQEIIIAAKNIFFCNYGVYPRIAKDTLDKTILSILAQCTSDSPITSSIISLRDNFVENIPFFLSAIDHGKIKASDLLKLLPKNCIISPSDKQVGISILPFAWYIKEYKTQLEKGGHEKIIMTEEKCLATLLKKISEFRNNCSKVQDTILVKLWPKQRVDRHRIGVLKLVPKVTLFVHFVFVKLHIFLFKVHKIKGEITPDSWKTLSSRPIRGAETDPMRAPSKVLYLLLKEMLDKFSHKFPTISNNQIKNFTVLNGCDDYIERLSRLKLDSDKMLETTLISADFGDAYTETGIHYPKFCFRNRESCR